MSDNPVFDRIKEEIDANDVVLFMKGNPMFPQCGFSAAVVGALTQMQVKFKGVDVLQDMEIREGIKQFSSWPTIPQLYVKGEFVGGCDIVQEMRSEERRGGKEAKKLEEATNAQTRQLVI